MSPVKESARQAEVPQPSEAPFDTNHVSELRLACVL